MLFTGHTTVGDFLKSNTKLFLKTVLISAVCLILFIGAGYFYLRGSFVTAQNENNSVPYYKQIPQNSGLLFEISGDKTYFYLDFENQNILVAVSGESFEYPVDFKVNTDLDFVADFVDSIEGIELVLDNKTLRYTGVQVEDLIIADKDFSLKRQRIKAICDKISNVGMTKEMFSEIIERCETNLTVPALYGWLDYIKEISANLIFIDN